MISKEEVLSMAAGLSHTNTNDFEIVDQEDDSDFDDLQNDDSSEEDFQILDKTPRATTEGSLKDWVDPTDIQLDMSQGEDEL